MLGYVGANWDFLLFLYTNPKLLYVNPNSDIFCIDVQLFSCSLLSSCSLCKQFLTLSTIIYGREISPTGSTEKCFRTGLVRVSVLCAGSLTNIPWNWMHFLVNSLLFIKVIWSPVKLDLFVPFAGFRVKSVVTVFSWKILWSCISWITWKFTEFHCSTALIRLLKYLMGTSMLLSEL